MVPDNEIVCPSRFFDEGSVDRLAKKECHCGVNGLVGSLREIHVRLVEYSNQIKKFEVDLYCSNQSCFYCLKYKVVLIQI